jgi:hypothetical protein
MKQLLAFAVCIFAACSVLSGSDESELDCGCLAEIKQAGNKEGLEVVFYRILAEELDGELSCGFGYAPIKVENPTHHGEPLVEIERSEPPAYAANGQIDPGKPVLAFRLDGVDYIQDSESVERSGTLARVRMKRFSPRQ